MARSGSTQSKKLDYKRELKELYGPRAGHPAIVDVPELSFLMVDGMGDPNASRDYREAVEVLFAVSYRVKFAVKRGANGIDYGVMPLEGLWWVDDMSTFSLVDKSGWSWTAMIMQPDVVTEDLVQRFILEGSTKKPLPAAARLRFARFREGMAAQVLYTGPYGAEGPTIEWLHGFMANAGYRPSGKHHEIYLSDPSRAESVKLRTIIRQPVSAAP